MRYFYEQDCIDGSTREIEVTEEQFDSELMDMLRRSRGYVPFIRAEAPTYIPLQNVQPSYHW